HRRQHGAHLSPPTRVVPGPGRQTRDGRFPRRALAQAPVLFGKPPGPGPRPPGGPGGGLARPAPPLSAGLQHRQRGSREHRRWHGPRRVERFLHELRDVVKQADPASMVTYANYPPTEYLDLSAFDFVTFNVYLHDPETFRRYLLRLQNLVGDRPLVLG